MPAPPNDVVIEVAKAIAKNMGLSEASWPKYLTTARDAIEAMRQPSHAMMDAARKGLPLASGAAMQFWERAIDAALT